MLTPKENFLETLKKDGKPDRLVNQYQPFVPIMNDPLQKFTRGNRVRGKTSVDRWGTEILFPEDAPGPMPHVTEANKVCPDVTRWQESVKVPDLIANCSDGWEDALSAASQVDRSEKLVLGFMGTGIFEQSHFLMGFEDALMNLLLEPESMQELVDAIAEYRFRYAKLLVDNLHPDIILSHDDWGSKQNVFLPPRVWRQIIKPLQKEIADTIHDCGMIYMHHADCICQPIVTDMVEIGVDIWQGTIAQNDIVEIQRVTEGKLAMVGGIDGPKVDIENITEEEIRAEVRRAIDTYCPGGRFYPSIPNGICFREWNNSIVMDELHSYGRKYAQEHPVGKYLG